jgi:methyl-accepting chemotaxis protein
VQEITAASDEQSTGVNQINTAMGQLSQLTQQNAAGSEELAATSEEMTAQAEKLRQVMSFFSIGGSAGRDGMAPPTLSRTVNAPSHGSERRSDVARATGGSSRASDMDDSKFRRMRGAVASH